MATLPTLSSIKSVCDISGFLNCQVSCRAVFNATIWYCFSFAHDASAKTEGDSRGQSRCVVLWCLGPPMLSFCLYGLWCSNIYTLLLFSVFHVEGYPLWWGLIPSDQTAAAFPQFLLHSSSPLPRTHTRAITHHHVHADTTNVFQMKRLKPNSECLILTSQWRLRPEATT